MKIRLSSIFILILSLPDEDMPYMEKSVYECAINGFPAIIVAKRNTDQLPLGFEENQDRVMNNNKENLG
jgi:hypothetical protein